MTKAWLAGELRRMREAKGLTQSELAALLPPGTGERGTARTQGYVQKLETAISGCSLEEANAWARACGFEPLFLFRLAREASAEPPRRVVESARGLDDADADLAARFIDALRLIDDDDAKRQAVGLLEYAARQRVRRGA